MNWIDKKYKEQLGERQFSDSLRQKGKDGLSDLLDQEFPVSTGKPRRGAWFYTRFVLLGLLVLSVPAGIWYFSQDESGSTVDPVANEVLEAEEPINNITQGGSMEDATQAPASTDAELTTQEDQSDASNEEAQPLEGRQSGEDYLAGQERIQRNTPEAISANTVGSDNSRNNSSNTSSPSSQASEARGSAVDGIGVANATSETSSSLTTEQEQNTVASNSGVNSKGQSGTEITSGTAQQTTSNSNAAETRQSQSNQAGDVAEQQSSESSEVDNTALVDNGQSAQDASSQPNQSAKAEEGDQNTEDAETNVVARNDQGAENVSSTEEVNDPVKKGEDLTTTGEDENNSSEALASNQQESTEDELPEKVKEAEVTEESNDMPLDKISTSKAVEQLNLTFADLDHDYNYTRLSPKRMAISIWGGYAFTGRSLSGGSTEYLALRNSREEVNSGNALFGFSFDYLFNQKWTLSVGLGFSEYGEKVNYEYRSTNSAYIDGRAETPKNYPNVTALDSVRIIDSINVGHWNYSFNYSTEDTVIRDNNGATTWSYVEVPILVGYRFGSGKVKPWLQAGLSLGIPQTQNFRYISPGLDGLQSVDESRMSVADLQLSGVLNMGVDYSIHRHFSLRANLSSWYQLNAAYKFGDIRQRYYHIGATVGVAYIF